MMDGIASNGARGALWGGAVPAETDLEIRQASRDDVPAVFELVAASPFGSAGETLHSIFKNPRLMTRRTMAGNEIYFLARRGGTLVGALCFARRPEPGIGALPFVAVAPGAHRQGVGKALVRHLQGLCRDWRITKLLVNVAADNRAGCQFLTACGFLPEGLVHDIYGRGRHMVLFGLANGSME